MNLSDFEIGSEFLSNDTRWRCTDIGRRVVVAIRVDESRVHRLHEDGRTTERRLTGEEAEAEGWFNGPPYAVLETVFDEYDQEGCEPVPLGP